MGEARRRDMDSFYSGLMARKIIEYKYWPTYQLNSGEGEQRMNERRNGTYCMIGQVQSNTSPPPECLAIWNSETEPNNHSEPQGVAT